MPNQDASLTGSDRVALVQVLNRIVPHDHSELAAGTLGILETVEQRLQNDPPSRTAFMRIVEALSLDMMSHAVGGFTALTNEEQISSIRNIETTLPSEFNIVLKLVRDVYYEDERTPDRPENFDSEAELFGKIELSDDADEDRPPRHHIHKLS